MKLSSTFTSAVVIALTLGASPSFADAAKDQAAFQAGLNKLAAAEAKCDAAAWTKLVKDESLPNATYLGPDGKPTTMAVAIKAMKDQFAITKSVKTDTYTVKSYTPQGDKATAVVEFHGVADMAVPMGKGKPPETHTFDSTMTFTFHQVKTPSGMKTASITLGGGKTLVDGKPMPAPPPAKAAATTPK